MTEETKQKIQRIQEHNARCVKTGEMDKYLYYYIDESGTVRRLTKEQAEERYKR